jgi:hypothetical protein
VIFAPEIPTTSREYVVVGRPRMMGEQLQFCPRNPALDKPYESLMGESFFEEDRATSIARAW